MFLRNKYASQKGNAMEKINYILTRKKCSKWLDSPHMPIPMAQVLRLYIHMFPSYGLYACINLETAHHRTTFRIFCNITQNTTPEENSHKMFHIFSPIVHFSHGKVKDIFWWWRSNFIWGGQKEGVRGSWGRSPKSGLFVQNSHY